MLTLVADGQTPRFDDGTLERWSRETLIGLDDAQDLSALTSWFSARIRVIGFQAVTFRHLFGCGRNRGNKHLFGDWDATWEARYSFKNYDAVDPAIVRAFSSTKAFTLAEIAEQSQVAATILADIRQHGVIDGLITPVRSGDDHVGMTILLSAFGIQITSYQRMLLQGASQVYGSAGLDLCGSDAKAFGHLTRRETECLCWVAGGRSDPQIGLILGLSSNTVHTHVESAKRKLDANSRAQMVLRAAMAGIIRSE